MLVNIQILCFASCYVLALVLEIVGLYRRATWRRLALLAAVIAGFVTHTLHLAGRAADSATSPLSSPYDWYLLAAWVLAAIYLGPQMYQPQSSAGLFLLPPMLVLIAGAQFADRQQFVVERASRTWGNIHGTSLLLGTVTVMIGFTAGLMYLVQSYRLKHGLPPTQRFRLPSLEWLESVNSRSLAISAFLIALGFVSGVILNQIRHAGDEGYLPWTDPVVVSLALMLLWLIVAEVFRLTYRAARGGRKVAYLTVATFIFLMISLAVLLFVESGHSPEAAAVSAGSNRQAAQTFLSVRVAELARIHVPRSSAELLRVPLRPFPQEEGAFGVGPLPESAPSGGGAA
jgi:ABC-type uncharacterized transport system permease subunit